MTIINYEPGLFEETAKFLLENFEKFDETFVWNEEKKTACFAGWIIIRSKQCRGLEKLTSYLEWREEQLKENSSFSIGRLEITKLLTNNQFTNEDYLLDAVEMKERLESIVGKNEKNQ